MSRSPKTVSIDSIGAVAFLEELDPDGILGKRKKELALLYHTLQKEFNVDFEKIPENFAFVEFGAAQTKHYGKESWMTRLRDATFRKKSSGMEENGSISHFLALQDDIEYYAYDEAIRKVDVEGKISIFDLLFFGPSIRHYGTSRSNLRERLENATLDSFFEVEQTVHKLKESAKHVVLFSNYVLGEQIVSFDSLVDLRKKPGYELMRSNLPLNSFTGVFQYHVDERERLNSLISRVKNDAEKVWGKVKYGTSPLTPLRRSGRNTELKPFVDSFQALYGADNMGLTRLKDDSLNQIPIALYWESTPNTK